MDFTGTIIKESLVDDGFLADLEIVETNVEPTTERHNTPWVAQWTKLRVVIPENWAEYYAEKISECLDADHAWYADFKNEKFHYIIFPGKPFLVDLAEPEGYQAAREYGLELGIPEYQLEFGK